MKKYLIPMLVITILFSCKKEDLNNYNSSTLHFSTDTITFDTLFATIGSPTKTLKIYNRNNYDIITDIELKRGSAAHFRINVNGTPTTQYRTEIPAQDSIFIFVEVTIEQSNNTLPYILADSLVFTTGNNQQYIDLVAWGQDAHFHTSNTFGEIIEGEDTILFPYHLIDCSIPWTDDKPHVIYGYAIINPGETLTINEGCDIYLHKNSGIIVGNPFTENTGGTIKINGTLGNEVIFQGDRLDSWYKDMPGQWDRIWLTPGSINNEINYAIIKNGNIGIHADTVSNSNPTAEINNTIIQNMSGIGILGQGANITGNNILINNCGQYTLACNIGGNYNFTHCTFANYWDYSNRNTPSILLNNYYEGADGNIYIRDLETANFTNCIIDGIKSTELSLDKNDLGMFNYNFNHCLIKLDPTINTGNAHYTNTIINQPPRFVDNKNDFQLKESSPAINSGNNITEGTFDIQGNIRTNPDIGAYELIE